MRQDQSLGLKRELGKILLDMRSLKKKSAMFPTPVIVH